MKFSKEFAKIRQNIKKQNQEVVLVLLEELQEMVHENREALIKSLAQKELKDKPPMFFEELEAGSTSTKLTYAPKTGRVTLKYGKGSSEKVRQEIKDFIKNTVLKDGVDTYSTVRGRVQWDKFKKCYYCELKSERDTNKGIVCCKLESEMIL